MDSKTLDTKAIKFDKYMYALCKLNFIIFQCSCPVSQMEFTAHIFTHHCKLTLPDLRRHLRTFVNGHNEVDCKGQYEHFKEERSRHL